MKQKAKHKLVLTFAFLLANVSVKAQDCSYMQLRQGAVYTYNMFDAKDKPSGSVMYNVKDARNKDGGVEANVFVQTKDEKGKDIHQSEARYICNGEKFLVDMNAMLSGQQEAFKNMEVRGDASYIEFPTELVEATTLPDGKMHLDMYNEGQPYGSVDIAVTERNVEAKESVATPAGTFDAFRIKSKMNTSIKIAGIGFPTETNTVEWYAKGVGMVKQESYNKNGKKVSSVMLASKN